MMKKMTILFLMSKSSLIFPWSVELSHVLKEEDGKEITSTISWAISSFLVFLSFYFLIQSSKAVAKGDYSLGLTRFFYASLIGAAPYVAKAFL